MDPSSKLGTLEKQLSVIFKELDSGGLRLLFLFPPWTLLRCVLVSAVRSLTVLPSHWPPSQPSQSAATHRPFRHQNFCRELLTGSSHICFIASRAVYSPQWSPALLLLTEMRESGRPLYGMCFSHGIRGSPRA